MSVSAAPTSARAASVRRAASALPGPERDARIARVAQPLAEQVVRGHGDEDRGAGRRGVSHRAKSCSRAPARTPPQLGVGGCAPSPRKRDASLRSVSTALAMPNVAVTSTGCERVGAG